MDRIYQVVIRGRTLESRNLKELLARAVSMKRDLDRRLSLQTQYRKQEINDKSCKMSATMASEARG